MLNLIKKYVRTTMKSMTVSVAGVRLWNSLKTNITKFVYSRKCVNPISWVNIQIILDSITYYGDYIYKINYKLNHHTFIYLSRINH